MPWSFLKKLSTGVVLLAGFCSTSVYAQPEAIDSLSILLKRTGAPARQVEILNALTLAAVSVDLQQARDFADKAIATAEENDLKDELPWARLNLAVCLITGGETKKSASLLRAILGTIRSARDASLEAYVLNLSANLLRDQGKFDSAYQTYERARRLLTSARDPLFASFAALERTRYFLILSKPDSALSIIDAELSKPFIRTQKQLVLEAKILKSRSLAQMFRYAEATALVDQIIAATKPGSTPHLRARVVEGEIRFRQGDFPGAMEIWLAILDEGKQVGYRYDLANLLLQLGESYEEQGYWKIATQYLNSALSIAEQSSFRFLKGEILFELAWISYRSGTYRDAWQKALLAEREYLSCNVPLRIGGIRNIQGLIKMGEKKFDSSLLLHKQALRLREGTKDSVSISSTLFNLGELYNNRREYQKALPVLRRGVRIDRVIGDHYGESLYLYQLGRSHNGLNNLDSVEGYLKKAIALSVPNSSYEILQKSYFEMADFKQKIGQDAAAIEYLKKYVKLRDSLYNKQAVESIASYETLFELDKKEEELSLIKKERELSDRSGQLQEVLLYILSGGIISVFAVLVFYYRISNRLRMLNRSNTEKAEELASANKALQGLYTDLQNNNTELKSTLNRLQETQEQLVRSEKMASLGVLSAGIAHELNNPLNFIKGGVSNLEMLADKDMEIPSADAQSFLQIIQEGVSRATAILKGLGQYSRQTDHMTEVCDLHKILDNCLLILGNTLKYHVSVERDYTVKPFFLIGNEGKLHQAIINIVSNAEHSISGQGTITVSTEVDGNTGTIRIRDTGCGIPPENLKRLGDLFFTTKEPGKGTGLGLSITYKIIAEHYGKIEVSSVVGKGTEFQLIFSRVK